MAVSKPDHGDLMEPLMQRLTEFKIAEQLSAILDDDGYIRDGNTRETQIDVVFWPLEKDSLPLAIEVETGQKGPSSCATDIRRRFPIHADEGLQSVLVATEFTLSDGDQKATLREIAQKHDAAVIVADDSGDEVQFIPDSGMDSGILSRLRAFLQKN